MGDALWMNLLMRYFSTKPSPGSSKKSGGGPVMAGVLTTLASPIPFKTTVAPVFAVNSNFKK